jgi:processive 1,2-diacylglycerol beta-glucosyltransferase
MITLRDKETGRTIGTITPEQLRFLKDQLEEETDEDSDYYLNEATLEMFAERGIDPTLLRLLQDALGGREEMEIEWSGK